MFWRACAGTVTGLLCGLLASGGAAAQGGEAPLAVAVGRAKGVKVAVLASGGSTQFGAANLAVELIARRPGGATEVDRLALHVPLAARAAGKQLIVGAAKPIGGLGRVYLRIEREVKAKDGCAVLGAALGAHGAATGRLVVKLPGKVGRLVVKRFSAAYALLPNPSLPSGCPQEGPPPSPPLRCPAPPSLFAATAAGPASGAVFARRAGKQAIVAVYLSREGGGRTVSRRLLLRLAARELAVSKGKARLTLPSHLKAASGSITLQAKRLGRESCPVVGVGKGKLVVRPLLGGPVELAIGSGFFAP